MIFAMFFRNVMIRLRSWRSRPSVDYMGDNWVSEQRKKN